MKKLIMLIGILGLVGSTAVAQNDYAENRNRNESRNYSRFETNERDVNRRNWGYDSDWNRTSLRSNMKINSFQRQARERIANGIVEGTINSNEARRLLEQAERIEIKENRYLRNGRISNFEARELQEDLNKLNRMISRDIRDFDKQRNDDYRGERRF
jgi:hypothetical protein